MCRIVSVAVHPKTLEVFHIEGVRHHSELCQRLGLDYDKVFKPEIVLSSKKIQFMDGSLAIKRTIPPELLQTILAEMKEGNNLHLSLVWEWTKDHQDAVMKWLDKNLPSYFKLIEFSENNFNRSDFKGTVVDTCALRAERKICHCYYCGEAALFEGEGSHHFAEAVGFTSQDPLIVRKQILGQTWWKRHFEKPYYRSMIWGGGRG